MRNIQKSSFFIYSENTKRGSQLMKSSSKQAVGGSWIIYTEKKNGPFPCLRSLVDSPWGLLLTRPKIHTSRSNVNTQIETDDICCVSRLDWKGFEISVDDVTFRWTRGTDAEMNVDLNDSLCKIYAFIGMIYY